MLWQSWVANKVTFEGRPEEEEEPQFPHPLFPWDCRDAQGRHGSALTFLLSPFV